MVVQAAVVESGSHYVELGLGCLVGKCHAAVYVSVADDSHSELELTLGHSTEGPVADLVVGHIAVVE
jgi:hypothetical protein